MEGVVTNEVLNQMKEKYCQLEALHSNLQQRRPSLFNRKGAFLSHDNARRPYIVQVIQENIVNFALSFLFSWPCFHLTVIFQVSL